MPKRSGSAPCLLSHGVLESDAQRPIRRSSSDLLHEADLRCVNTANVDTGTDTNDATVSDTVIYNTAGTTVTTDDYAVMVLEDYTTPLTVTDFDVV